MTPSTNSTSSSTRIYHMAVVGLMTAIICILAPFSFALPVSPVPISLGTFAIYFATIVLGMKQGVSSVLLYILLGLCGLPVFSGFTGGIGKLLGPTGGYILGYIFMALICGFFADKWQGKLIACFFGMLFGTIICYAFGTIWLSFQSGISLSAAFASAVLPFLPADLIKIFLANSLGYQLRRRLKKAKLIP